MDPTGLVAELVEKEIGQQADVRGPLSQGREVQPQAVESAEPPGGPPSLDRVLKP